MAPAAAGRGAGRACAAPGRARGGCAPSGRGSAAGRPRSGFRPGRRGSRSRRAAARGGSSCAPAGPPDNRDGPARPAAALPRSPPARRRSRGSGPVRSMTLHLVTSSSVFCWTGVSAASTTSSFASCSSASSAISSAWPLPNRLAGRTWRKRKRLAARRRRCRSPRPGPPPPRPGRRASASPLPQCVRARPCTARSPRVTPPSSLRLKTLSLRPPALALAAQVERMAGLHGRNGMLVDQLHLPAALEHQRELVEAGDRALQHHAIDQEDRHRLLLARRGLQEQVLQHRLLAIAPLPATASCRSAGAWAGMMVEMACL